MMLFEQWEQWIRDATLAHTILLFLHGCNEQQGCIRMIMMGSANQLRKCWGTDQSIYQRDDHLRNSCRISLGQGFSACLTTNDTWRVYIPSERWEMCWGISEHLWCRCRVPLNHRCCCCSRWMLQHVTTVASHMGPHWVNSWHGDHFVGHVTFECQTNPSDQQLSLYWGASSWWAAVANGLNPGQQQRLRYSITSYMPKYAVFSQVLGIRCLVSWTMGNFGVQKNRIHNISHS